MKLPLWLIDAFAERPFSGNPAGVVLLEEPIPDTLMQDIATELAQAETAISLPRSDGSWELRWFAPLREVAFCGHATLAAAHAIATERNGAGTITFRTRFVGDLRVRSEGRGRYVLDLPRVDPAPADLEALRTLVPEAAEAFATFENVFAVLPSEQAVRDFAPDLAAIEEALGGMGLAITARGAEADMVSRYFAPAAGIPEDQVTGSIHATLAPFWAARLGRTRLVAEQASRRGGRILCDVAGERVLLTGGAVTVLRGEIVLPD